MQALRIKAVDTAILSKSHLDDILTGFQNTNIHLEDTLKLLKTRITDDLKDIHRLIPVSFPYISLQLFLSRRDTHEPLTDLLSCFIMSRFYLLTFKLLIKDSYIVLNICILNITQCSFNKFIQTLSNRDIKGSHFDCILVNKVSSK